MSFSVT